MSAALEAPYTEAETAVQAAPVTNADETGWALAGQLCWLWMAVAGPVALFKMCAGRGRSALADRLGDRVQGTLGSDRWTA